MIIYLQTIGIRSNKRIIIRIFNLLTQIMLFFKLTSFRHITFYINAFMKKTTERPQKNNEKTKHNQIIYKISIKMNNSHSFNCVLL